MTKEQTEFFRRGYEEYRNIIINRLRDVNSERDLSILISQLRSEIAADLWRKVQEEQPGITHEEYEAQLNEALRIAKEKHYSKLGG